MITNYEAAPAVIEEIRQREREKSILLAISGAISSTRTATDLLTVIREKIQQLISFYDTGILIVEPDGQHHYDLAVRMPGWDSSQVNQQLQAERLDRVPHKDSYLAHVIQKIDEATTPVIEDWEVAFEQFSHPFFPILKEGGYKQALVTTLKSGGKTIGTLWLNAREKNHFHPTQFAIYQALADQVAVAVANILANEEILEREQEKTKLLEISETIAQVKSTDNLLKLIIDKIKPLFRFHDCGLFIVNTTTQTHTDLAAVLPDVSPSEWNERIALVSKNVPHPGSPVEWMMAEIDKAHGPVLFDFQELAAMFPYYPQVENIGLVEMGYRDCLATNLKVRGQSIGMFCINALEKDFFIPARFSFFQSVTNGVSIAVANILANEELERKAKEKTLQLATLQLINQLPAISSHDAQVTTLLQIAQEIDWVMPFDMLVSNTFFNNLHFLSSCFEISKQEGIFRPLPERESFRSRQRLQLHQLTETQLPMAGLFRRPGVYVGQAFADICANYPNPKLARDTYGIQSVMYVPLRIFGKEAGTIVLASRQPQAFTTDQLQLVEEVFAQLAMAIENLLVCEDLNQREREKSLQLALNNTLVNLKAPDQLAQALACEINRIVPFEGFNLRIYRPKGVTYHTYLYRGESDEFTETLQYLLVQSQFKLADMEQLVSATDPQSGLYEGESCRQFCARHELYQFISQLYSFQSLLVFRLPLAHGYCAALALWSAQPSGFKTYHFDLLTGLLPQVSLALENLLSFDDLHRRDEQKATQLAISNILLTQQQPTPVLPDIAAVLDRSLSCDLCCLLSSLKAVMLEGLSWGAVKSGEQFMPVAREEFLQQAGLSEEAYQQQVSAQLVQPTTPHLYVGESFDQLLTGHPLASALTTKTGIKSLICQPLVVRGGQTVTLVIGSRRAYAYTPADLETTQEAALQMALALENRLAFAEIEQLKGQFEQENVYLQDELKVSYNFDEIVGESPALDQVFNQVRLVAPTDSTVLIEGETGTGKELIARAIHNYSPRKSSIMVKVNCAALPANLIESELFGHEKGAFTGALERRLGKFELANGGTIFLDEIGELPLELQAKLLRAIQEREIERVGGKTTIRIDVRIVAATNKNLAQESKGGTFRTDLYYRLNVFPILLPPLRQRREDIPLLATHFARKFTRKMGKKVTGLSPQALQQLMAYDYPGNIRELEHIIEHAVILSQGNRLDLGRPLAATSQARGLGRSDVLTIKSLQHHERDYILQILKHTGGRIRGIGGAAELLGIHPNTLESRMQKLGIQKAFVL
ncbi:sigma 54-interacting transcriptional regulator [Spirosoma areae]